MNKDYDVYMCSDMMAKFRCLLSKFIGVNHIFATRSVEFNSILDDVEAAGFSFCIMVDKRTDFIVDIPIKSRN